MNNNENSVRLIGHLGADPEIVTLPSGKKLAHVNLATSRVYQDSKGELVKETTWHRIVVFGEKVKFVEENFTKGKLIGIEGRISNRSYDAPDGNKRYISEIICQDFLLLNSPGNSESNPFKVEAETEVK